MCIEDIRINREKWYRKSSVTVDSALANGFALLAKRDANRTFFRVSTFGSQVYLFVGGTQNSQIYGPLRTIDNAMELRLEDVGEMVTDEIYGFLSSASAACFITEVFLNRR